MATPSAMDLENGVCERLRSARRQLGYTLEEFSRQAGITRAQLEHYEYKRARLPFEVGLRICRQFIISERWLATGEGEFRCLLDLRDRLAREFPYDPEIPSVSFLEGYKTLLSEFVSHWTASHPDHWYRVEIDIFGDRPEFLRNLLNLLFEKWCAELPRLSWGKLFIRLEGAGFEFVREVKSARAGSMDSAVRPASALTEASENRNNRFVVPSLDILLHRLVLATGARGKKAQLAKHLGVPQSRVSEWLSGKSEPGGSTTLRLLAWVTAEEEKKPGGDHPPRGRSTR